MRAVDPSNIFQSTLSVRRATYSAMQTADKVDISIHALRKESDQTVGCYPFSRGISIHALRKESDPKRSVLDQRLAISIHALRKESDHLRRISVR